MAATRNERDREAQMYRLRMHEQSANKPMLAAQAAYAQDYGIAPQKPRKNKFALATDQVVSAYSLRGNIKDSTLLVAASVVLYLLMVCLYQIFLFRHAKVVFWFTVLCLAACSLPVYFRGRSMFYLSLTVCCTVAVLSGILAGTYCYETFGYFSFYYANLRTYENVVPSESTAVVADAGRMTFAKEARLDQSRSTGFAADDGHMYCAAPIVGMTDDKQIDFWAVGMDCCKLGGRFMCDAADDFKARSGIVMLEGAKGIFSYSNRQHFDDARRKAQAFGGFSSVPSPMYLRWVTASEMKGVPNSYDNKAALFILGTTVIYGGIATVLAKVLAKTTPRLSTAGIPEI